MKPVNDPISLSSAFIFGLLGGAHCIGMCGGIMNALSFAIPAEQRSGFKLNSILLAYNIGRIFSYMIAGAIIGGMGWWLQNSLGSASILLRVFAGVMLVIMGLYLSGWWMGLRHLEQAGNLFWKRIEPLGKRLLPVTSSGQAVLLGTVWGWLPCGLVYSVLIWSLAAGDWLQSLLIMLSFGLGTLPVMFVTGRFAHKLKTFIQKANTRRIAAILMILFGVWTIIGATQHATHDGSHHEHSHHM